jgi:predicted ATP-grasp superfamily ATP-dependent carboligase
VNASPTPKGPLRVLVTDSHSRAALAVTRALGEAGHWVLTAGTSRKSLAAVSRYSSRFEVYPQPQRDPTPFIDAISGICERHRIDVLLPVAELTTILAINHAARLPAFTRLPAPAADSFLQASDKIATHRLAAACGVPVPRSEYLMTPQAAVRCREWDSFPAVVKPARSQVLTTDGWKTMRVSYAATPADASRVLASLPVEAYPVMIQERITGPGTAVFTCMQRGRPMAWFAHERIREMPPSGGVSVLCRSIHADPEAIRYASLLLQGIHWHGVAMVEFKRDARDGSLRLMEINGRLWGSLQLAIDAGVNFPNLLVHLAADRPVEPTPDYRIGCRNRWLWGDISNLMLQLTRNRRELGLPEDHPGRIRALWNFLHLWGPGLRYEIERFGDLAPAWLELRQELHLMKRPQDSTARP